MENERRLTKLEENVKSNQHRLDKNEEKIEKLEDTYRIMEKMDFRMSNVEKSIEGINNKLDKQETKIEEEVHKDDKKKSVKWDKLIDYIFYALLAYALIKLGLK